MSRVRADSSLSRQSVAVRSEWTEASCTSTWSWPCEAGGASPGSGSRSHKTTIHSLISAIKSDMQDAQKDSWYLPWCHRGVMLLALTIHVSIWYVWMRDGKCNYFFSQTVALACWLAFDTLRADSSSILRVASLSLLSLWLCDIVYSLEVLHPQATCAGWWTWHAVEGMVNTCSVFLVLLSVQRRIALVGNAFGSIRTEKIISWVIMCYIAPRLIYAFMAFVVGAHAYITESCLWLPPWSSVIGSSSSLNWYLICLEVGGILSWLIIGTLAVWTLLAIYMDARRIRDEDGMIGYLKAEAAWAEDVLRSILAAESAYCGVNFLVYLAWLYATAAPNRYRVPSSFLIALNTALCLLNFSSLLILTNAFRPQKPELDMQLPVSQPMHAIREESRNDLWVNTVGNLAGRCIEVGQLLRFYSSLGKEGGPMPHYSPLQHTTSDVVRAAIIPFTRTADGGGKSYAELRQKSNRGSMAQCIVTHEWQNLFLHLVAAVVADALGKKEYEGVVDELAHTKRLLSRLKHAGTLRLRYWICAFCINQHASICNTFGPEPQGCAADNERWEANRRDTATRDLHRSCPCAERKISNDSPDECEMNKFDDLLECLARESSDFYQLVAVDRKFHLFQRVWCIAELVQAHLSRVPQHVCVFSDDDFAHDSQNLELYIHLANLSVQECRASRPEDKAEILAKIADVTAFDLHLQAMIFGKRGLMSRHLVGFDIMFAATLSAKRVAAARNCACGSASSASSDEPETSSDEPNDSSEDDVA